MSMLHHKCSNTQGVCFHPNKVYRLSVKRSLSSKQGSSIALRTRSTNIFAHGQYTRSVKRQYIGAGELTQ